MNNSKQLLVIIPLLILCYFSYQLIEPYMNAIVLAFIFSLLAKPIQDRVNRRLINYPNFSALVTLLLLITIIFIPFSIITFALIKQTISSSQDLITWTKNLNTADILSNPSVVYITTKIESVFPLSLTPESILKELASSASRIASNFLSLSSNILGNFANFFGNFFIMVFILFFLLRDQEQIINKILRLLPFSATQENTLLLDIENVTKSAVLGSFITALAQGVLGAIAMFICGFPPLLLGTVIGFASFIPVIGTSIIWLPIAIYLFIIGEPQLSIFLIIWGIIVIGSIDNLLRPLLMQGKTGMNTVLIFLSLLGGLYKFGLLGVIYGPLIFSITIVFFHMYENIFKDFLNTQDQT